MPRLATLDYDGWTTEMWAHWSLGVLLEDDKTTRQGTVTESMDGVGTDCSVCARRRNTFRQLNTRQRFPLWFYANRGPSVLLYCTAEWSRVECPFAYYDFDYYYYWLCILLKLALSRHGFSLRAVLLIRTTHPLGNELAICCSVSGIKWITTGISHFVLI